MHPSFKTIALAAVSFFTFLFDLVVITVAFSPLGHIGRWIAIFMCILVTGAAIRFIRGEAGDLSPDDSRWPSFLKVFIGAMCLLTVGVQADRIWGVAAAGTASDSPAVEETITAIQPRDDVGNPDKSKDSIQSVTEQAGHRSNEVESALSARKEMPQKVVDEVNRLLKEADGLIKSGNPDQADEIFEKALKFIDTESPWSLYQRGQVAGTMARVRMEQNRTGEAMDVLDGQIAKLLEGPNADPGAAAAFHETAGEMLGNRGMYAESIERFNLALTLRRDLPTEPRLFAGIQAKIAVSYARMNEKEKAQDTLKIAEEHLKGLSPPDKASLQKIETIRREYGL